jgi:hypothetical protein
MKIPTFLESLINMGILHGSDCDAHRSATERSLHTSVYRKENVCVFDYIARSHIGNVKATYYLTMPSMPPDTAKPDLFSMQTYYVESQAY